MNRNSFLDLADGRFGRKTAYTDVDEITEENVVKVVGKCIGTFNYNKPRIKYLWDYKNGDQPIRFRQKTARDDINNVVIENHAWEIVRFKNGQTYGEPVQLVSLSKEDSVNEAVEELNNLLRLAHKSVRDITSGEWTSAVGTGFKATQLIHNAEYLPFRITVPTPMDTFIIYSRQTKEPMLSVQELRDEDGKRYLLCFSDTHEYRIQDSHLLGFGDDGVTSRLHIFKGIPIVEYPNNQDRISDIELVISMLDAINTMQSNRVDAIEQFVQSWVKFVNCDIDKDTFQQMKMMGALVVKSNNGTDNKADVDVISQELSQSESQIVKEDMWDNILNISAIPNKQGSDNNSSSDSQGAVALRNGWDFSKQASALKDAYIKESEMRLCEIILNIIRVEKKDYKSCNISMKDFEVVINHSPLDNLQVKTQVLQMLLSSGIHPLVAVKACGIWSDAEKVFIMSRPYFDNLYKTIDMAIEEQNLQGQLDQANQMIASMNGGVQNGNE